MSDLVKQLRSEAANWAGDLLDDAADRIEALEAEVASLREANQTWADMFGPSAALAEEQDK